MSSSSPCLALFLVLPDFGLTRVKKKKLTDTRVAPSRAAVVGRLFLGSAMNVRVMTNDRINSIPNAWIGVT